MKLRNKKTGEIKDWSFVMLQNVMQSKEQKHYASLARLCEEWEDYEISDKFYFVNQRGFVDSRFKAYSEYEKSFKEIGNYFETKEEAELAVRKLKAWKRLKDKGFVFCGTDCIDKNNVIYFEFGERPLTQKEADEAEKDLDLLFGGEE